MDFAFDFIGHINHENILVIKNFVETQKEPIGHLTISISSEGGSVHEGIMIYNYLKKQPFSITTHNLGEVASAAILLYLTGNTRTAEPISKFLIHSLDVGLDGHFVYHQVEEHLKNLDCNIRNYAAIVNRETNSLNGKADVDRLLRGGSLFLSPVEAVEYGIATKIPD